MSFPPFDPLQPEAEGEGGNPSRPSASLRVRGVSRQDRDDLGRRLKDAYESYLAAVSDRLENARDWWQDVDLTPADLPGPWPGSAQVRSPLTAWTCQGHSSRLNGQVLNTEPPFSVTARTQAAVAAAPVIEEVLAAKLEEANWKHTARQVHQELPVTGNCLVRVFWKTEVQRVPDFTTELVEERAAELATTGAEPGEILEGSLRREASGLPAISLGWKERLVYDGVELTLVPFDRMVVFPPDADNPEDLWARGERKTLRGEEIRRLAKEKVFFRDTAQELLARAPDDFRSEDDDDYEDASGVSNDFDFVDPEKLHAEYEVVELFLRHDLNGDGYLEWYYVTFHAETGRVLRLQYSPYQHGRCPYVLFRYLTRPGRLWARSVAEWLAGLQSSSTDAKCSQHDLLSILKGTASSFIYDRTAEIRPGALTYTPGVPWRVNNINGIRELPIGQNIPQAMAACQAILDQNRNEADLLTATSNVTLGKESEDRRTLGEVQLVAGAAASAFEDYAAGVALCWAEVADLVRWNLAQFGEGGQVEYRVAAQPRPLPQPEEVSGPAQANGGGLWGRIKGLFGQGQEPQAAAQPADSLPIAVGGGLDFKQASAALLAAEVDLVPTGLGQTGDAQARLQRAHALLQILSQHPLTVTNRKLQAKLIENLLRDTREPAADQLMELIYEGIAAQEQAEQQQAQMQQFAMMAQAAEQQVAAEERQAEGAARRSQQETETSRSGERHQMEMLQQANALMQPPAPEGPV